MRTVWLSSVLVIGALGAAGALTSPGEGSAGPSPVCN
jgi:hypothetical protein